MNICTERFTILLSGTVIAFCASVLWAAAAGPLTVHSINPRYLDDGTGKAVYLTGAHTHNNLQDMATTDPPPVFNFDSDCSPNPGQGGYLPWNDCYLDFLEYYGHNFTRGWAWEQAKWAPWETADWYFNPLPFQRTGPGTALDGKPKFDLTQYSAAYFDRLRQRAIAAGDRGYYIGIMLFEGWSIEDKDIVPGDNPWLGHPMNASNNINGINGDSNGDGEGHEVHTLPSDNYYSPPVSQAVTDAQEAYVAHCIDELNDLDNIIWEISNESHANSGNWHYHMIDFIQSYEASKAGPPDNYQRHLVWMNAYDLSNAVLFAPACHAEVVSPNRNGPNYRNPPIWSENKIMVLDTDHLWGWGGDRDFPWRSFTHGHHPIYMDPLQDPDWPPSEPRSIRIREACGDTLFYAEKLDLVNALPSTSVSSSNYCLVYPGRQYLAFQPSSGSDFNVNLVAGQYDYEWFDPQTGQVTATGTITAPGGNYFFNNPYSGMAVLYLNFSGPRMPISIDLNDPDDPDGMSHPQPADGDTVPASIGGRDCRTNAVPGSDNYFYFGIDYLYEGSQPEVYIIMDYYDTGSGTLKLQYDSTAGSYTDDGEVTLTGSNTWKQHTYHVTDAYFGDRQNGDSDFRILKTGGGSFYLDIIRVSDVLPPVITQQPVSDKLHKGQSAQFNVVATGASLEYQWQKNGTNLSDGGNISGAATGTLQVSNVQASDAANYRCVVSNNGGDVTSDQASLTLAVTGDFDADDDVDHEDFGHFQACMTGTGVPQNDPNCLDARLDVDEDADLDDFVIFQGCMSGANIPANPGCAP
ncbi:MAG: immunoglobulin domain-containing protein [Planctomycetota bacterium]|jgi:hypothetical protein